MKPTSKHSGWFEQLKKEGFEFSSNLDKKEPKLYPDLIWIWSAFLWLGQRRSWGFSAPQYISPESIKNYCDLFDIDNYEDKELLIRYISVLDNHWMQDWIKKEKAKQNKTKSTGKKF